MHVLEGNEGALRFYERLGFQQVQIAKQKECAFYLYLSLMLANLHILAVLWRIDSLAISHSGGTNLKHKLKGGRMVYTYANRYGAICCYSQIIFSLNVLKCSFQIFHLRHVYA